MGLPKASAELEREIGQLCDLPRLELVKRWQELYRADPPRGISTRLMVRAITYEVQATHLCGLSLALERKLGEIVQSSSGDASGSPPMLTVGTRLVREWQGRIHVVDVMEEGFAWDGRVYPSLSKIAREITDTRWSGPRFFGLRPKREGAA